MNGARQETVTSQSGGPEGAASFKDFHLVEALAKAIEKMGFTEPTPIQARTYTEIMSGGDMIAMSQTGTGKTAAFGIPMAQKLDPGKNAVQALVLAPTRELALQVCKELETIGGLRKIHSVAVYGGASFTNQVYEVSDGAQIVVGTPGRVLDHIHRGTISFDDLEILVLDEADEMLSMGFEREISAIIESLPAKRQTLLFSATIPSDIERLANRYMGKAAMVLVSGDDVAAKEVSHFVYLVSGHGRPRDLEKILEAERPESAIIFCNTRDETTQVARHLKKAGYDAQWLNSDLSQAERDKVMALTRGGGVRFLVATDVAARGIDISHISHVINYTFPDALEVYIHRTGRTGRMGRHGSAISLIAPHDIGKLYYLRLTYKIFPVEKTLPGEKEEERHLEFERLDSLRREFGGTGKGELGALAARVMQDARGEQILTGLLERHFPLAPAARHEAVREAEMEGEVAREREAEESKARELASFEGGDVIPTESGTEDEKGGENGGADEDAQKGGCKSGSEIYVDAGRKDGLRIAGFMKEVVELSGLSKSSFGKVRMLARSTFVMVLPEHMDKVIAAIGRVEVNGRKLKAEPASQ